MLAGKRALLIVGGGIAAYKSLDLIRKIQEEGGSATAVLTKAGKRFVTPLSLSALTRERVYQDLFSLTDDSEMGHIELSRSADLVVVAPATADLIAKMAGGHADDLASTILLATDKRVLAAPAMNVRMWLHPSVQRNVEALRADGVVFAGPNEGQMACGEHGPGRMAEPAEILESIKSILGGGSLAGHRVIVTSGATREAIDPVRYISNRSSGMQGSAIGRALVASGAEVVFITGAADAPPPPGAEIVKVESAEDMAKAVEGALPAAAAVCVAAVADWGISNPSSSKIKKSGLRAPPELRFRENPDILASLSRQGGRRPRLVVGFAAETENVAERAREKLSRKGCDWILANDVSERSGVMGGDRNQVIWMGGDSEESWPEMTKDQVASRLAERIANELK